MFNLINIFESIENLAYNILIWILIVPKTLARIIVDPGWVPKYITSELKDKEEQRFDDYFSPVILILLVAIVPFIFYIITPEPRVSVEGTSVVRVGEDAFFSADADFISETPPYIFTWTTEEYEPFTFKDDYYPYDFETFRWNQSGPKYVDVTATNGKGESIYGYYYVYVAEIDEDISGWESLDTPGTLSGENSSGGFWDFLQGQEAVLPALVSLGIPLLFALAVEAFRGIPLSRTTLMRSFYIQCYYFAPFYLTVWGVILGQSYFITPAENNLKMIAIGLMAYFALWLFANETRLIAAERDIHWIQAVLIVLACLCIIALPVGFLLVTDTNADLLRVSLLGAYFGIGLVLVLLGLLRSILRKRS